MAKATHQGPSGLFRPLQLATHTTWHTGPRHTLSICIGSPGGKSGIGVSGLSCGGPDTQGPRGGEPRSEHISPLSPSNKEGPTNDAFAATSLFTHSASQPAKDVCCEAGLSVPICKVGGETVSHWAVMGVTDGTTRHSAWQKEHSQGLSPWSLSGQTPGPGDSDPCTPEASTSGGSQAPSWCPVFALRPGPSWLDHALVNPAPPSPPRGAHSGK